MLRSELFSCELFVTSIFLIFQPLIYSLVNADHGFEKMTAPFTHVKSTTAHFNLLLCVGEEESKYVFETKTRFFRSHHSPPTQTGPQHLAAAIHLSPVFVTEALADGQDQNLKVLSKWTWNCRITRWYKPCDSQLWRFHYSMKFYGTCDKNGVFTIRRHGSKEKNVPMGIPRLAYRHAA